MAAAAEREEKMQAAAAEREEKMHAAAAEREEKLLAAIFLDLRESTITFHLTFSPLFNRCRRRLQRSVVLSHTKKTPVSLNSHIPGRGGVIAGG
jgi:hypothetical protein